MSVSFSTDVVRLFTGKDIGCMRPHRVYLDDVQYMSDPTGDVRYADYANARHVYGRLSGTETPRMPSGGPFWDQAKLAIFESWIKGGFLP